MDKLLVNVLYHKPEQLLSIDKRSHLQFVNLNSINANEDLAENRIFFNYEIKSEFVGIASASWHKKYPESVRLENLNQIQLKKDEVCAPDLTENIWALQSEYIHPGMFYVLANISSHFNLNLIGATFWANNFICHRDVFSDFLKQWMAMYEYSLDFYKDYNRILPFHVGDENKHRHIAYLGERLTCLYFANRKDLKIISTCDPPYVRVIPLPDLLPWQSAKPSHIDQHPT